MTDKTRRFTMDELTRMARGPLAYAAKHEAQLEAVAQALEGACGEALIDAYVCSSDLTVGIAGTAADLGAAWGALRAAGFKITSDRPADNAATWCGRWVHPETALVIYVTFQSRVCRRVKVGTKLVEQDVYETVCGEPAPAEAVQ